MMAFWRAYYHLVWATKRREPLIDTAVEEHLYPFLISKAGEIGMHVYAANGWVDHVHMVASIPPRLSVSEAIRRLKGASSRFIDYKLPNQQLFTWQRGYSVFTLGSQHLPRAAAYVKRQKEHHGRQTTSRWLEKITQTDDGPTGTELDQSTTTPKNQLKESAPPYKTTAYPF